MEQEFRDFVMQKLEEIKKATILGSKEVLTIDECALFTGYKTSTLYTFTCRKMIPHFKKGNSLYFSKKEIEEWMQSNPIPTNEDIDTKAATRVALNPFKY